MNFSFFRLTYTLFSLKRSEILKLSDTRAQYTYHALFPLPSKLIVIKVIVSVHSFFDCSFLHAEEINKAADVAIKIILPTAFDRQTTDR